MQESTEKFYRKCRIKGLTTGTIDGYRYSLSTFQQFYQGNLNELAQDDIDEYAEHLLDTYTNITTVNNKLRDLRVFLRWADLKHEINLIKNNEPAIIPLKIWQLKEIYDACLLNDNQNYCHYRDYIIMRVLEETGMRISEVLRLQVRDMNMKTLTIHIRESKNKKARVTFFTQALAKEIGFYLELRQQFLYSKQLAATSLFTNNHGQPLARRTISENITEYGEMAGITGVRVSPHTFRHTFAKNYLLNGGDIFTLKDILGHSTLDMVYRYARLWDNQRSNQYQRVMENYTRSKKRASR